MTLKEYILTLESRLSPIVATLIAINGGGRDSNGQPVPGLAARIATMPQELAAVARWARENAPWIDQDDVGPVTIAKGGHDAS